MSHHCIVAEIAFDDAPTVNSNGVTESPENSDKLAQRNLQITSSGNPSFPLTHSIPQAFDMRPSGPVSIQSGSLLNYPDELMIDWGNTPVGSVAKLHWPQIEAADVITLGTSLYGAHSLTASGTNTVQCPVVEGVTYVPILPGAGKSFAGLFSVDPPNGIHTGRVKGFGGNPTLIPPSLTGVPAANKGPGIRRKRSTAARSARSYTTASAIYATKPTVTLQRAYGVEP